MRGIGRASLLWLAILYVLVGVVYALVTPAFEKPDEDGHYGYIRYLREHRALPPLSFSSGFPSEYKQPPLYYVVTSVLTGWLPDVTEPEHLLAVNPYMDFSVPGCRNDNRNQFLHPPYVVPLILAARLVSLLFGLGTVIASYFLACQLLPGKSIAPIAAAAVVGFQPKFLYMATAVNNDAAIAFLGTLAIAVLMVRLQKGAFPRFAVLVGGILGLASITKVSGLVFVPLAGLALLLIHRGFNRHLLRDAAIIVAVALLVGGWWYARNALVYGDPLSTNVHTVTAAEVQPLEERFWRDLSSIERTFWANLSRTFVSPTRLDAALIWWGRISLVLLASGCVLNRAIRSMPHAWLVLLSWPLTFLLLLTTYWAQEGAWAYGRLLFPVVAPIGLFLVLGWWLAFPPGWRRLTLTLGAGMVVTLSALVPFVSIYPLYHPWHEVTEEQIEHPVDIVYLDPETGAQVARLIGYGLPEPSAFPGTVLPVELCWKPLAQTRTRYAVFVHLLDLSQIEAHGSPGIWGSRRTYPGLGNLPTDRWTPGAAFCDRVLVQVSPEAPTPLGAAIEVGLIDPETDGRLHALDARGNPVPLAVVASVPLLSPEEFPTLEQPPRYVLDDALGLNCVQLAPALDRSITLTLTWLSLRPVAYDATTFVHLIGANGETLAQVDRQPLDGRFPTSYWIPGQVVTDVIGLSPAPVVPEGPLVLKLGMYTWPSLERLPVVDASRNPQDDNVIVIDVPPLIQNGQE
jgi:4-amino-4-deoxy-L-arabinose transferase-like glycosyltransferase